MTRRRIRRTVIRELHNVRTYRRGGTDTEAARAWIRVGDKLLEMLRDEPQGDMLAEYADALYGITRRPIGNARYVNRWAAERFHMSEDGLRRWREVIVYNASILAFICGAIDLSSEP